MSSLRDFWTVIRSFKFRAWAVALAGAFVVLIAIGIPTEMIENPWFTRMTPVRTQDYAIWTATAVLAGIIAGTYAAPAQTGGQGKVASGGLLSFLAVGCPICNKLVVLALGVSGALTYFAPVQIYLGLASLVLLGWALRQRVRALSKACDIPARVPGR